MYRLQIKRSLECDSSRATFQSINRAAVSFVGRVSDRHCFTCKPVTAVSHLDIRDHYIHHAGCVIMRGLLFVRLENLRKPLLIDSTSERYRQTSTPNCVGVSIRRQSRLCFFHSRIHMDDIMFGFLLCWRKTLFGRLVWW